MYFQNNKIFTFYTGFEVSSHRLSFLQSFGNHSMTPISGVWKMRVLDYDLNILYENESNSNFTIKSFNFENQIYLYRKTVSNISIVDNFNNENVITINSLNSSNFDESGSLIVYYDEEKQQLILVNINIESIFKEFNSEYRSNIRKLTIEEKQELGLLN